MTGTLKRCNELGHQLAIEQCPYQEANLAALAGIGGTGGGNTVTELTRLDVCVILEEAMLLDEIASEDFTELAVIELENVLL